MQGIKTLAKVPYKMSPKELIVIELKILLVESLDLEKIQPSKSPFGALILFQEKASGSLKLCVDYQGLNKVIIKNKYPAAFNADLFDRLSKAQVFTKLDLRSGYWQVRITLEDVLKTIIVTRYWSYEFLEMSFGLTNALLLLHLMNDVFHYYIDKL